MVNLVFFYSVGGATEQIDSVRIKLNIPGQKSVPNLVTFTFALLLLSYFLYLSYIQMSEKRSLPV